MQRLHEIVLDFRSFTNFNLPSLVHLDQFITHIDTLCGLRPGNTDRIADTDSGPGGPVSLRRQEQHPELRPLEAELLGERAQDGGVLDPGLGVGVDRQAPHDRGVDVEEDVSDLDLRTDQVVLGPRGQAVDGDI